MGIAIAAFGWTGQQFMRSTPHEFIAAYEQWRAILRLQESWAIARRADSRTTA